MKYVPGIGDNAEALEQARHHLDSFKIVMAGIALKAACPKTVPQKVELINAIWGDITTIIKEQLP